VTRIRRGRVEEVCHFSLKTKVKLGTPQRDDAQQSKR
jgi:hypothetical protein